MAQIILDSANNLIQGDFDTATLSLRTRMQTSTTNATTGVYVVPNGSATSASIQMSNAADPTNASKLVVSTNGATDTQIVSGANGSGSYLPLSFYTNNDIRFQMGTTGELNVRTAPGTVSSGTSGQFLTSGGPGAGVSWTTAAGGFSNMQVFTSPGTFTTPATTTKIKVTVVGSGGGGGVTSPSVTNGSVGGGGGGGAAIYVGPVTASTPYAVTVGTAGAGASQAAGSNANPGTAGNTSSFGSLASATGGGAGEGNNSVSNANGGAGGAGSAGTLLITGASGQGTTKSGGPILTASANGGPSYLGGGGRGNNIITGASVAGGNYGGGGGGTLSNGTVIVGASGAGGVVIVEY
jgi:hypothetical protein